MLRAALAALVAVTACSAGAGENPAVEFRLPAGGPTTGSRAAPVILVEFGSFDCASCLYLHQAVYPESLARYVSSGLVRVRYVDLSMSPAGRNVAGMVECATRHRVVGRTEDIVGRGFAWLRLSPDSLLEGSEPVTEVPAATMRGCLADPGRRLREETEREVARDVGVLGTPTLVIGYQSGENAIVGWPLTGAPTGDRLGALLDSALVLVEGRR